MKGNLIFKLLLLLLIGNFGALNMCFAIRAQSNEEPSRIKNFGASLKPGFDKNAGKKTENKNKNEDEVIRVKTELVVNDLIVMDKQGMVVNGLTKDDFIVKEDGIPQTIEEFSRGDGGNVPRSIVLIIDYSGSLRPYIKTSIEAAKVLIDKLKPKDRMAIVTDDVKLLTDFTNDKAALKEKLDVLDKEVQSGKLGHSEQYSALFATLNELFDKEDVRPIVIFQTDGDEYSGLKGNFKPRPPDMATRFPTAIEILERNFSYKDVVTASEKAQATIYTIIPGRKFIGLNDKEMIEQGKKSLQDLISVLPDAAILRRGSADDNERRAIFRAKSGAKLQLPIAALAKFSGGWADFIEVPEQAADVYSRVLADINSRYVIGYYPTNQAHDGKRRVVSIEVRDQPGYIIWGRKSYFATEENN